MVLYLFSNVPDDPVVTLIPTVDLLRLEGNVADTLTLICSWSSPVYYIIWFENKVPLYTKDLVSGVVMDRSGSSLEVDVGGQNSMLTFSQVNDSGNYTCAVTCRAKGSAEGDIPVEFKATKEVLIYGALTKYCCQ